MQCVCYNGDFFEATEPLFTAQNRAFRYGDGLFETMKLYAGNILFSPYHFDRLFTGLQLLQIKPGPTFTVEKLTAHITALCQKNNCTALARVRLAVFRTDDGSASFVIEAFALTSEKMQWQPEGWTLEIHPSVRKSCDAYANLKTANYLPYVLAGEYARENDVDECLVLNTFNNICDGSKTNIFLLAGGEVYTPALHQGVVNGVMRNQTMDILKSNGYTLHQTEVTEQQLLEADEVFVTNAIEGVRWVKSFRSKEYGHEEIKKIYGLLQPTFIA